MITSIFIRILVGLYLRKEKQVISHSLVTIPNIITFVGIVTILLYQIGYITYYIFDSTNILYDNMLLLIIIVIISDVLDGFFARSLQQCSYFGQIIDPARDRYLILAIIVHMIMYDELSLLWFAIPIVTIEMYLSYINWKTHTSVHFLGKIRMVIHMIGALIFIAQQSILGQLFFIEIDLLLVCMLLGTVLAWSSYQYGYSKAIVK